MKKREEVPYIGLSDELDWLVMTIIYPTNI